MNGLNRGIIELEVRIRKNVRQRSFGPISQQRVPVRFRRMQPSLDQAYLRWRGNFAPFEARCFEALCGFVRVHFDDLLDRYYSQGHQSFDDFPEWAFERYLQHLERKSARQEVR